MKRFLISILLFLIPLVIVLFAIEYGVRSIPNDYSYKNKWLCKNISAIRILTLGSSHSYFGVLSQDFDESAFNAAHVSQSLKYDAFIIEKFIKEADSLQIVLIPISYFSLWSDLESSEEWWRAKNYCLYYKCPYHRWEIKYRTELFNSSVYPLIKQLTNYYVKGLDIIGCDTLGRGTWYNKAFRNGEWWMNGLDRALFHTYDLKQRQRLFEENKKYVEDIINKCYQKQIKVLLFTTPTYYTYYDNVNQQQLDLMLQCCDSFAKVYENTFYLDLFKDKRFTEDDFFDADHLNEFGAAKLTSILQQTIDTLRSY